MHAAPAAADHDGPRRTRLSAQARRTQLVEAAAGHFARTSYRAATMADVAAAAGVTAALAYRHFPSKAELFAACMDHEWQSLRARWDAALALDPPPEARLLFLANAFVDAGDGVASLVSLWFQAIAEAHEEPVLRATFDRNLAEMQEYLAGVTAGTLEQQPGDPARQRDASVEAWIFIGIGMLVAADMRTGLQVLGHVPSINRERIAWLYGHDAAAGLFG